MAPARERTRPLARYTRGAVIGGRYELETPIGHGAVGQVWVARSLALGSRVALKLFWRSNDEWATGARFIEEARAAAQLDHPAIVRVFDYGETGDGAPFLVMERLHGESLESMLARGPLDPVRAVQILLPMIDALHAAHSQGLIHRDIKPANLFLAHPDPGRAMVADAGATQWSQPKVIDFGLVKRWREGDAKLTPSGMLVGSPAYMAPEQALGNEIDARADVWALCVVLYELVTGRLPFNGETAYGLFKAVLERAPARAEGIDPELVAIVMRGMVKRPAKRWQSMFELGVALARWLVAQGVEEDAAGACVRPTWIERRRVDVLARGPVKPSAATTAQPTVPVSKSPRRRRLVFAAAALLVATVAVAAPVASRSRVHDVSDADLRARMPSEMHVTSALLRSAIVDEDRPAPKPDEVAVPAVRRPTREASRPIAVMPPMSVHPSRKANVRDPELGF